MALGLDSEQTKDRITALLAEREGYVRYGRDDKVTEVDAQLAALGHKAAAPAKRAEKRPRSHKRAEKRS